MDAAAQCKQTSSLPARRCQTQIARFPPRSIPIGTNHLPGRPILEADEHFRLVGVGAELMRKSFVYAAPASMRIHGTPNCFSALRIRWQHVPIGRRLVDHGRRGPMQTNVILTGAAVPNADCAFSAPLPDNAKLSFGNRVE